MHDYGPFAKQFWRDGFLVLEAVFDANLMDLLNQLVLDNFGPAPRLLA